jgi:hypothetical protein
MRLVVRASVFVICLGVPGLVLAEEKFDIKLRKDAKGDVELVSEHNSGVRKMRIKVGDDTVKDDTEKTEKIAKFTKEVLEVGDKDKVIRQSRIYEKGSETKDGVTEDFKFIGKKVLIEKTKDEKKRYRFTYAGGEELTKDEAAPLDKEFNKENEDDDVDFDKMLLPGKPVALNETWKVDVKGLFSPKELKELKLDFDKAVSSAQLVKAYKKGAQQWGVIEIQLEIPLKAIKDEVEFKMEKGSTITMKLTADTCIDGKSGSGTIKMAMKLKGEGRGRVMDQDVAVVLDAEESMNTTDEQVEKK